MVCGGLVTSNTVVEVLSDVLLLLLEEDDVEIFSPFLLADGVVAMSAG